MAIILGKWGLFYVNAPSKYVIDEGNCILIIFSNT